MKDPDSSTGNSNSTDEPSLADLLLGDSGGAPADEAPRRVEHRADEPDSGMVNLARMVAQSSVDIARSPSIAPPPAPAPEAVPGQATGAEGSVSGVLPVPPPAAAPAAAPKKGSGPLIAVVAIAVVAIAVVAYLALGREQPKPDDSAAVEAANRAAQLMAEMQAKAEADRKAAEEKEAMLLAKLEELTKKASSASDGTVSAEDQAKIDAAKEELKAATAEKEKAAEKAEEQASSSTSTHRSKSGSRTKKSESEPAEKASTASSASTSTSGTAEKASTPKTGADELGDLLGGSKKTEEKKPAVEASDGVPKQPSKEQVNAAMAPIKAKAQNSCAKYSTGVVTVSVVVSNEGKVKSATPTGVFANNPAGTCVAMMARSAKFPKFKDPTFTFTYPITLQ